jgi:hypothetical protein
MSQMRNIYFSDEAFAVIEKPIYEDGKMLRRSAKINRMILEKMENVQSKTQVEIIGLEFNLKAVAQELRILKNVCHESLDDRFVKLIQVLETQVAGFENKKT